MRRLPPIDFIPGIEILQWTLLPQDRISSAVVEIEPTFPVHTGQFLESSNF